MKKILLSICAFLLILSESISAQNPDPKLNELSWLSGYWTSSEKGAVTEELWTHGSGYIMLGLHRDVAANHRSSFEYLRIALTQDGLVYIANPSGSKETVFKMTEHQNQKIVFENLEHDFPQRIIYKRTNDTLYVKIEDESGEQSMQWKWQKTVLKL